MAHFAELTESGVVTNVVVVNNGELLVDGVESEAAGIAFLQSLFGHNRWVQTSYNARIRKHYAGIDYTYDAARDAFIPPQPFPSWVLDEATCDWAAPIPYPEDGGLYVWDEQAVAWETVNSQ
jgi:hypothetical protein